MKEEKLLKLIDFFVHWINYNFFFLSFTIVSFYFIEMNLFLFSFEYRISFDLWFANKCKLCHQKYLCSFLSDPPAVSTEPNSMPKEKGLSFKYETENEANLLKCKFNMYWKQVCQRCASIAVVQIVWVNVND